jgi:hypothetical protein
MRLFPILLATLFFQAIIEIGQHPISAQNQITPTASSDSVALPLHSVPQHSPCVNQPKTLNELAQSFLAGHLPAASETTGSWVAIGLFNDSATLNCMGLKRSNKFEWAMIANRYSVEIDMIGSHSQTTTFKPGTRNSLGLVVDFEGDSLPVYRCRLTNRQTLACLLGDSPVAGAEFKKMSIKQDDIYKVRSVGSR